MKGTEKQIAWATEIVNNINKVIDYTIEKAVPTFNIPQDQKVAGIKKLESLKSSINSQAYAGTVIDHFNTFRCTGDMQADFNSLMSAIRISGYKY